MKLYEGGIGCWYQVEGVCEKGAVGRRLEALGIRQRTRIFIYNKKRSGAVIVKVRGTRLAMGRGIAERIEIAEVRCVETATG